MLKKKSVECYSQVGSPLKKDGEKPKPFRKSLKQPTIKPLILPNVKDLLYNRNKRNAKKNQRVRVISNSFLRWTKAGI